MSIRRGLAASAVAVALTNPGAMAQTEPTPQLRLVVTAFDGVVGPGSPVGSSDATLRIAVDNVGTTDVANIRVVVEAHARARSRGLLRASLDRDIQAGPATAVTDVALREGGELLAGDIATAAVRLDGHRAGWMSGSGVHPVAISVVRGTEVLDRVLTAIVHLAAVPTNPLDTLVVWPIDDAPWRLAADEFPPGVDAAAFPGGRLDRMVRALEQVPEAPVAITPSAHLLEDLVDRADGFREIDGIENPRRDPESTPAVLANGLLQRVRATVAERPVPPIATPYARVDLALLAGTDESVAVLASSAAATGADRLAGLLGRAPDPGTSLAHERIGDAGLAMLSNSTVVVSRDAVVGPSLDLDADLASPVRQVTTEAGRRVTLLVADPYIEQMLAHPDADAGPAVAAQRVVAESAMVHFEAPGISGRPLIVLPPPGADLPGDMGGRLLGALVSASWLALGGPEAVRDGAEIAAAELREVTDGPGLPDDLAETIAATSALVDGLDRTLVVEGTDAIEPALLRDDLARATSAWFRSDVAARRRGVARVRTAAETALGTIEVAGAAGITLTSDEGTIPITLRRPEGSPLDVRVVVDAQGRLGWPDGNQSETIRLSSDGPQTVAFTTVARSRGTFPIVVSVTDPTGDRILHEATISVRSTAISGPAVLVLAGTVVVLIAVGVFRRRPRETRLRVVQDLAHHDADDEQ